MKGRWLGLIELFVALLFIGGWFVLEWVVARMDKRRKAEQPHIDADN
jgi:hypothetical protein